MKLLSLLFMIATSFGARNILAENDNCTRSSVRCDNKQYVRKLSDTLASKFSEIVVKELGSEYTAHFEIRTAYKVSRYQTSDNDILTSITDKLAYKLSSAVNILKDMNNVINDNSTPSFTHPCPFNSIRKSVFIKNLDVYEIPSDSKTKMMDRIKDLKVKRRYFLSHMDYATDKDCATMPHSNLRYLYHKVVNPDPKLVVFIIDNQMKADSLQHAVNVVKETAYALQNTDVMALKMTNTSDFVKFEDTCSTDGMSDLGNATDNNKLLLREYLSSLEIAPMNLSPLAINKELKNLLAQKDLPKHKLFIFLTDTKVLKNETWLKMFPYAEDVNMKFAIGLIYENHVDKNSSLGILHIDKWHNHSNNHSIMRLHINDSGVIGQVASAFISLLPVKYENKKVNVEGPIWEATDRDFMISLVLPTHNGVLGVDLYWSDLAEDIIYFKGSSQRKRAFVMDSTGLKNEIQQDVGFLNSILSFYKRQHLHGAYSKYIVRRYAVTESGVLVMFPGTVLEYDYEPVRRPWYTYALENPGKIILTPPNLDVGGAGYVVSISYAVKSPFYPTMVVAMDVTMGFLYKLLIDSMPLCAMPYAKCFIMNNRGYLVSHPGLMDPNSSGPIEQQHITHKESMIAIDMLNHKGFVTKRLCNNFYDKTIQRFYEFNTSLPNVLSNVVSGDHCVHYYIAAIPGTNAFVGLVNASCSVGAFCPCSMVDRLCLNCNRMEQNECECPCECSSEMYECPNVNFSRFNQDIPLCGMMPENNNHKSHYFHNFAENLKSCFDFQCETYLTHSSCLGVLGCEWCQIDTDGKSPLSTPFCTSQSTCFNGVLGAVTPYGEGTFGHLNRDAFGSYSAIGPIAGCIVTVSLVVAVAIYCYRQNSSSASCHNLYVDGPAETWHDADVQMSHLQSDDMHDQSGQDKLLPAMEIEAPISPYRVVTGYRRPHTAGGSDHGYSTMTPHEDSEATGFSVNDPTVLSDDTKSDVSGPLPAKIKPRLKAGDMSVTVLPCGKNSVIAPVTVHRHMEAS
ncbi:cache domain-containing protein [Phthorimaea operculella]|nr:cache domain-containing protein [Phthorimaea operculella]